MYLHSFRFHLCLLGIILTLGALPGRAGVSVQTTVGFTVSTILADPQRNYVYVVDQNDNEVLQFDMTTGLVVATAPIADGTTQGNMAISSDDSKLYVQETDTYAIAVYSLPSLTPLPTITPGLFSYNIACGENGRLFETAEVATSPITYVWVELDPSTGAYLGVYGFSENYTNWPLLRSSADGSHLYVASPGFTGSSHIYQYSLAGGSVSGATGFAYNSQNMVEFKPDDANGRIYIMDTSLSGVNVLVESDDNDGAVWPLLSPEAGSVDFSPGGNVIYGASAANNGDIRAFNRPGGTPIANYVVGVGGLAVPIGQIAVTPNGNCFFVAYDEIDNPSYTNLGIISPGGIAPALQPTIPSTILFPPPTGPYIVGNTYTLSATDSLGLPITYSIVSGFAQIVGNQLIIQGAGTIVIQASTLGNANDEPESTQITINVPIVAQTIAPFAAIPDQAVGVPFSITIPAASSGLPVSLSVLSGSATIAGHVITATAAGTLVLAANQPGNAGYSPAPQVTTSVNIDKGPQTIRPFGIIAKQYLNVPSLTITLPTASSGLPVTLTISGPATLSGNKLTLTGTGTVTLMADQGGNANYDAAPEVTTSFNVYASPSSLAKFGPIANRVFTTTPFTVPVPSVSSGLPVTISVLSGNAFMSGSNQVTLTGAGTIVLAANQVGNLNFSPAPQVTTSFIVTKASQTIAAFAPIAPVTFGVAPFTVTVPTASSGLPVSLFLKSGPASLTGNTLTILGAGTVVLAADQAGGAAYNAAKEVTTNVTVSKISQTITPFATIPTKTAGTTFTVTLPTTSSGLPVTLTLKSGPAKVAGNVVTTTGIGTVILVASQAGSAGVVAAAPVSTSFQVTQGTQTIAAFTTITAQTFNEAPFKVTPPLASSGLPVTVTVLSGPATISSGRITLTAAGTVVLAANQAGNTSFSPAAQVTTSFTSNPSPQTITPFRTILSKTTSSAPFKITVPTSSSNLPVTVTVLSGPATISGSTVTITGAGVVLLGANQAGDANYNAAPQVLISFAVN